MEQLNPEGGLIAARRRLAEIWADPQIRAIARKHANSPQVAEDALQITYLAMFRLRHLGQIENLPGYFCRVLIRAVYHEQARLGALLVDDFPRVIEQTDAAFQRDPSVGLEDMACTVMQAQFWHRRLIRDRDELMGAVPGRSSDPARYRRVIYAAAEQILRAGIDGEISEADSNETFRASYPEYFDAPGVAKNTSHQRLSRARLDVRELLQTVVGSAGRSGPARVSGPPAACPIPVPPNPKGPKDGHLTMAEYSEPDPDETTVPCERMFRPAPRWTPARRPRQRNRARAAAGRPARFRPVSRRPRHRRQPRLHLILLLTGGIAALLLAHMQPASLARWPGGPVARWPGGRGRWRRVRAECERVVRLYEADREATAVDRQAWCGPA